MKKRILLSLVTVLFAAVFAASPAFPQTRVRFPSPEGHVTDKANVISESTRTQIEKMLMVVENKTTAEVAVVTVDTTSPLTIEQYAVELFQEWGIGKKGKDNGVLILVATGDRKVRIEVGYGLEGALTDLHSKMIIEKLMIPQFKAGSIEKGVTAGAVMVTKVIADEYGVDIDLKRDAAGLTVPAKKEAASPLGSLLMLIFFILIFGFRFGTLFFFMSGRGRYWSSGAHGSFGGGFGGSSGGFGGFGGGFSGGGGASGSW